METPSPHAPRAVLRIGGPQRTEFLQGLITQDIGALADGEGAFSALLTPQGKILFDFFIARAGEAYLLDCRADTADDLVKRLKLYRLRADVAIDRDESLGVLLSPEAVDGVHAGYVDPRHARLGWRAIVDAQDAGRFDAYDRRRIEIGAPETGVDFSPDDMFPMDVNFDALHGVSYAKGCFVGQEVASRMKRKSAPRKRTLLARFDGEAPPTGTAITAAGSTLGTVLSGDGDAALALIRLDRWEKALEAGAPISADGRSLRLALPESLKDQ